MPAPVWLQHLHFSVPPFRRWWGVCALKGTPPCVGEAPTCPLWSLFCVGEVSSEDCPGAQSQSFLIPASLPIPSRGEAASVPSRLCLIRSHIRGGSLRTGPGTQGPPNSDPGGAVGAPRGLAEALQAVARPQHVPFGLCAAGQTPLSSWARDPGCSFFCLSFSAEAAPGPSSCLFLFGLSGVTLVCGLRPLSWPQGRTPRNHIPASRLPVLSALALA